MKNKSSLLIPIIILLFAAPVLPASFDMDYGVFRGSGDRDILEIYYSFPRSTMPWLQEEDGSYFSSIMAVSTIFKMGEPIYRDTTYLQDRIPDDAEEHLSLALSHQINLQMQHGDYAVSTFIYDVNNSLISSRSLDLNIPPPTDQQPDISSIEAITGIRQSPDGAQSPFLKYGKYLVYPDASRLFTQERPQLSILAEIYDLQLDPDGKNRYSEEAAILDLNNKTVLEFPPNQFESKGDMAIFIQNYQLNELPSGIYLYRLRINDLLSGSSSEQTKKIYVYNPDGSGRSASLQLTDYDAMNETQLDSVSDYLRPLFSRREAKLYKRSDEQGKKAFLQKFWEDRDPNPETIINEFQMEIGNRIAYANKNFSGIGKRGALSDQGRVLIQYGFPSDIQRYSHSTENLPFETWQYQDLEGGAIFVFADTQQIDYYELIHSTKKDEIYNENWQQLIRPRNVIIESY